MNLIGVFTAITGNYEEPKINQRWGNADWFFYGNAKPEGNWIHKHPTTQFKDNRINARWHKILPKLDYMFTIWIDGSISLRITPDELVSNLGDDDILVHKHPRRDCVYQEAVAILKKKLDHPKLVEKQVDRLIKSGYPEHNGLAETKIVVRRTATTKAFNDEWWEQLSTGSSRDQLSFNPAALKTNIKLKMVDLSPFFDMVKHQRATYS